MIVRLAHAVVNRFLYRFPRPYRFATLALTCAAALTFCLHQSLQAHEVGPSPRPLLPACFEADLRCSLPADAHATLPAAPGMANDLMRWPITPTQYHDGKWFQLMDGLVDRAHAPLVRQEPIYAVPCVNGFADVYPCRNVDLLAHLPYSAIGGKANNDSWGWRDPLDGHEYALIGALDGTIFLDITTPDAPLYLGKLPTHGTSSSWRDLKVYRDHLFIVADNNPQHGMQVFDLRNLRTIPRTAGPQVLHESAHYAAFENAHNIAINEATGFAYIVGSETCRGGLHMVDIRTPTVPTQAGCYTDDDYIHDTTCVLYHGPDPRYQGRELCFNASVNDVTIVDVTEKDHPTRIADYSNADNIYIHQGWLTADQRYFVMNDELDELRKAQNTRTYILNVEQVDAPYLTGIYSATLASIDHNLYISDTYIYEANYTTGLRVLDGKKLAEGTLTEVASFDTFPENDGASFDGAWTAYPYFRNGTVVVSTIESGVFILRPQLRPDVIVETSHGLALLCRPTLPENRYRSTVTVIARNDYAQTVKLTTKTVRLQAAAANNLAIIIEPTRIDLSQQGTVTGTVTVDVQPLASGYYTMSIIASSPDATELDRTQSTFHLADTPAAMPAVQAVERSLSASAGLTLTWPAIDSATAYRVEVATDEAFAHTIQSEEITATKFSIAPPPMINQRYYWRVSPINGCGVGIPTMGSGQSAYGVYLPWIANPSTAE